MNDTKAPWADHRTYSWVAMLDALRSETPAHWPLADQASHDTSRGYTDHDWAYGLDYEQATRLAAGLDTWTEGQASIEQQAREQAGKHVLQRPFFDYGYDVTGADYDVGAVLEGRPECWLMPQASNVGDPGLIRLVVDSATASGIPASDIEARMSAVAAAALVLEALGNPVEVLAIHHSGEGTATGWCTEVRVNSAGEPIDTQRLVALAHPAFHRRCRFRLLELTPSAEVAHDYIGCYARPKALSESQVRELYGDRAVYIPPVKADSGIIPTCEALLALVKARVGVKGADDYVGA